MLGHMRRHPQLAQLSDTVTGIIVFVGPQGDPLLAGNPLRHRQGRLTLGRTRHLRRAGIDDQDRPILREHMPQISQLGLLSLGIFVQAGLRVGRRGMRGMRAAFPAEVDAGIAGIIRGRRSGLRLFPLNALLARLGLHQGPIPGEVVVRQHLAVRACIMLTAAAGLTNVQIARRLGIDVDTVRLWRQRWLGVQAVSLADLPVEHRLTDAPRPGRLAPSTAEQVCQAIALACEAPSLSGRPISQWTSREIAEEMLKRGMVAQISPCRAAVNKGDLKPHLLRYGLTPLAEAQFDADVADICVL
jgi:putative transposase